jgi:hypothetical protein
VMFENSLTFEEKNDCFSSTLSLVGPNNLPTRCKLVLTGECVRGALEGKIDAIDGIKYQLFIAYMECLKIGKNGN